MLCYCRPVPSFQEGDRIRWIAPSGLKGTVTGLTGSGRARRIIIHWDGALEPSPHHITSINQFCKHLIKPTPEESPTETPE